MLTGLWMLIVVMCSADTGECSNYIMDADLSYTDCQVEAIMHEADEDLYSLSCERQE